MNETQSERQPNCLVSILGNVIQFLTEDLTDCRRNRITEEDKALLNGLLRRAERMAKKLEALDRKTPEGPQQEAKP